LILTDEGQMFPRLQPSSNMFISGSHPATQNVPFKGAPMGACARLLNSICSFRIGFPNLSEQVLHSSSATVAVLQGGMETVALHFG
jgi:hypothetical protein